MDHEATTVLLLCLLRRRKKRKGLQASETMRKRKFWVRDFLKMRSENGASNLLINNLRLKDADWFHDYFRMSPKQFDNLLGLVTPYIARQNTNFRTAISPKERLEVTLRYLAAGGTQRNQSFTHYLGRSTANQIIWNTMDAICQVLSPLFLRFPSEQSEWKEISHEFAVKWNFPHCVGAIDGKHIRIQAPPNSGSQYFNYKQFHSIVLMAMCDANYRFVYVDIGSYGRQSDGSVFGNSTLGKKVIAGTLDLPGSDTTDTGNATYLPYVIVGDAAFPLKTNLLRPYPGDHLPVPEEIFNYRLSRARRIIENAFGILGAKWRIFREAINAKPENIDKVIRTCVCLHNYLRTEDLTTPRRHSRYVSANFVDTETDGVITLGQWRQEQVNGLLPIVSTAARNPAEAAKHARDKFRDYFMTPEGSVPWQLSRVSQGRIPE